MYKFESDNIDWVHALRDTVLYITMFNIKTDYELHKFSITQCFSMNVCLGAGLLGNLKSFVFAGAILKYLGAVDQEAALMLSAPSDQHAARPSSPPLDQDV